MVKAIVVVGSLFTFVSLFVAACGNNPEKTQIMVDASANVIKQASTQKYQSAAGHSFVIDPETKEVLYTVVQPGRQSIVQFDPETETLVVDDVRGAGRLVLKKQDVDDQFEPLLLKWEAYKAENPNAKAWELKNYGPFSKKTPLDLVCYETRKGGIEAIYARPQNASVKYSNYSVVDMFRQSPEAQFVALMGREGEASFSRAQERVAQDNQYKEYLAIDKVQRFLSEVCALETGFDALFESMFSGERSHQTYGGKGETFYLPIAKLDHATFQVAGMISDIPVNGTQDLDGYLFSVDPLVIPVSDLLGDLVGGDLQSGVIESGDWDPTKNEFEAKKVLDSSRVQVRFDFDSNTFWFSDREGDQTCKHEVNAAISDAVYETRRPFLQFKNSLRIGLTVQSVNLTAKCTDGFSGLKKGSEITLFLSIRRGAREFDMVLLDEENDIELLSRKTFVQN